MKSNHSFTYFIILFVLSWALLVWLASCSTTKKTVNRSSTEKNKTERTRSDSTSKKSIDSTHVKTDNSRSVHKLDSSYDRVTEEVVIDWIMPGTYGTARDVGLKVKERKITTWEKGNKKTESRFQMHINDSLQVVKTDTFRQLKKTDVQLHDVTNTLSKDKKVNRFSWWWLLLLLIVPIYRYRKTIFPFL